MAAMRYPLNEFNVLFNESQTGNDRRDGKRIIGQLMSGTARLGAMRDPVIFV